MLVLIGSNAGGGPGFDPNCGITIRKNTGSIIAHEQGEVIVWIQNGTLRIYIYDAGLTGRSVGSGGTGIVWDITKLYLLRVRIEGQFIKAKIWSRTSPEPDWQVAVYASYNMVSYIGSGHVGFYSELGAGAQNLKWYSDIRITPIPKYGGMP